VLNHFGLGEEVAKVGGLMESMSYRKFDDGEVLCKFSLDPLYKEVRSSWQRLDDAKSVNRSTNEPSLSPGHTFNESSTRKQDRPTYIWAERR
jgi:hypothetical protein